MQVVLFFAVCLFGVVWCQNNHHPPHHPHPDNSQCSMDSECDGCDPGYTGSCNTAEGLCYCTPIIIVKRQSTDQCHSNHDCQVQCPSGGVCHDTGSGKKCDCDHNVGRR